MKTIKNILNLIGAVVFLNMCVVKAELNIESIDLPKIAQETKGFAMSLSDGSIEAIKKGAEEQLKTLPNKALGVNLLDLIDLKDGIINNNLAATINQNIQKVYERAENIKPFFKDPQTGLMLITTLYNVSSTKIPTSIKDLFTSILALAKKIVDSKNEKDIAGFNALRTIVNANIDIIEKIYANRNNLNALIIQSASGGFKTIPDLEMFKNLFITTYASASGNVTAGNTVEAIKGLIDNNGKELQDIFAKARNVSATDLASFTQTFNQGLTTAKNLIS